MVREMRALGRGVCAAFVCAVVCLSGRLYGVEVSFEGEATETTVTDLMARDGSRIYVESDGEDSRVEDCVSPGGTKCLFVRTDIPSKGVCFGVTTNEAGQIGTGFVQPDSRVLAFEAQVLPTMFDEPLESMPLAASVHSTSSSVIGGGGWHPVVARRLGMAFAIDGDIAVCPLELYDAMDEPVATNWCVLAGVREGDSVVTRSHTLENANGSPLPPVGDGWHKIVLRRMIVDGAVRYSVAIDGTETRSVGDGATNFLSVAASPSDPVRALRFVGTGKVNGIVLPDEKEPCLFGYEDQVTGRVIVSYLGEGPSIVIPTLIAGVVVAQVASFSCVAPEGIREIVVPANMKICKLDDFWNLERIVFADEIPFANVTPSVLLSVLRRADAIYYPRAYAVKWYKTLRNLGYGGRYGSYSGAWAGETCLDAKAVPAGFVNVITEIKGSDGAVAVPENWSSSYPRFQELFGSDLTKALTLSSGKFDAAGKPMQVWQDYVAGTDPTDASSKFTASVDFVGGKPVVTWKPDLNEEGAKLVRKYTIHGKKSLSPAENWAEVQQGDEASYNFFKVTVDMK